MKDSSTHRAHYFSVMLKFIGFSAALLLLSFTGFSQNTKGDRPPVKNQRQIRETKVKSYKRKEKGSTRDIAGRRLRTKSQSSANRANAKYPQPSPYSRRNKKQPEKPAQPLGRIFSQPPRESRTRAWKGDVSGYHLKRMKPTGSDAARNNVYPQKGPYVRYARKQPKARPPIYSKTIKGTAFVRHKPRVEERAWKGGADHGPIKNQSATGSFRNTYSQKGPYVAYYRKHLNRKEKPVSNRKELSQVRRFSRTPRSQASPAYATPSGSKSFIQRGKKNVYWGKYQKKERAVTSDITGGPLRTRNYKTMPPGLVGRDSLRFFGKKPFGDRSKRGAGGYLSATGKGQRGWRGDISGWRLRKSGKGKGEVAGKFVFPRKLSVSQKFKRGEKIQGSGFETRTKRGEQPQLQSVANVVYARDLGSKKMKGIKPGKGGGGSIRGKWNNNGQPLGGRGPGAGTIGAARYSGSFHQRAGFSQRGIGYSGNIRRGLESGFFWEGMKYRGNIKRSSIKGYSFAGVGYSGNLKRRSGFGAQGAGYSGNLKPRAGFGTQGAGYSGNLKQRRGFGTQGAGYSGNLKQQKGFGTQGAGYSGNLKQRRGFGTQGAGYSGNLKQRRGFGAQGAGYSGNIRQRRFEKGGGSVSGNLWNNNNQSVMQNSITPQGAAALRYGGNIERVGAVKKFNENGVNYSGYIKRGELSTGFKDDGVNYSGRIRRSSIRGFGEQGVGYAGNIKFKRPAKGGGSVSGKLMNNDFTKIPVKTPSSPDAVAIRYSGRIKLPRFKKSYTQNPVAAKESLKKRPPTETTFAVGNLQVLVKQGKYTRNPRASKYALPGVAPTGASVKASEYARSMKQYWHYKHNPNSASGALKVVDRGKAMARVHDYQGNVKMHKYSDSRLHPDAQFAHGYRDNVKGERTVVMSVKLLWGKLFRKSETQPENLKEKIRRPRYDKKEKGLWNE